MAILDTISLSKKYKFVKKEKMKKVISFSLWGKDPKYCVGAIKNSELAKSIYPGWETWFYCGLSVPEEIIKEIKKNEGKILLKETPGDWTGMFWRFEPISDPNVDVMISRDADSRLSQREKFAVDEWLKSEKLFHVMRDHPAHSTEILGGMWGAKKPILGDMKHLINAFTKGNYWQVDQDFLKSVVWPRVSYTTLTHDEFFAKIPFPTQRKEFEFVGDVFDQNEIRHPEYWKDIKKCIEK